MLDPKELSPQKDLHAYDKAIYEALKENLYFDLERTDDDA